MKLSWPSWLKLPTLFCYKKPKNADPSTDDNPNYEVAEEVTAVQPTPTDALPVVPVDDVVVEKPKIEDVIVEKPKKGHKRTPSSSPVTLVVSPSKPPKVPSSPTSSHKDSHSVQTAIESTPSPKAVKKEDEESKDSQPFAQLSPASVKTEATQDSPTSQKEISVDGEPTEGTTAHDEPEKQNGSPLLCCSANLEGVVPAQESPASLKTEAIEDSLVSQQPQASEELPVAEKEVPEDVKLPEGVTTLAEVKKLNEMIDDEKKYDVKHPFWDKISLFNGDITKIQVDAIVNAANSRLAGGGGVDGAIHSAAGYNELQNECRKHDRPVPTGEAVVTEACKLSTHVKKIIHCVGPMCYGGITDEKREQLESCYRRAIQLSEENGLRSIALCCISTGIYGYDNKDAARTVLRFLWKHFNEEGNVEKWDRVVLCLFMEVDKQCYGYYLQQLLDDPSYFDDKKKKEIENGDNI